MLAQEERAMQVEEAEKQALAQAEDIYNASQQKGGAPSADVIPALNENQGLDANSEMGSNYNLKDELKKSAQI